MAKSMKPFSSSLLVCPKCSSAVTSASEGMACRACSWSPEIIDGIVDLREDKTFDTLLDVNAYDEAHNIQAQTAALANVYERILREKGCASVANVFEIGAGSGNLTHGLLNSPFFFEIHTSDISLNFMKLLKKRVGAHSPDKLSCYLLNANNNPFRTASFDLVLGHSILRHLEQFETTLEESFRVTKPGGFCVFGEPVLDVHVFSGLIASIILHMEQARGTLDRPRRMALTALANRPQIKRDHLESDRTDLREIEDKFIFPINYMRELSSSIGFKSFDCISFDSQLSLGEHTLRLIKHVFNQIKTNADFLSDYAFLFEKLTVNYGEPMKMNDITPFSYFVFSK